MSRMLVPDHSQLCRLCLGEDEVNTPIFGGDQDISLKITTCLPVKVTIGDDLPKKICTRCSTWLDLSFQLWNTSKTSERQLLTWVGTFKIKEEVVDEEPNDLVNTSNALLKTNKPGNVYISTDSNSGRLKLTPYRDPVLLKNDKKHQQIKLINSPVSGQTSIIDSSLNVRTFDSVIIKDLRKSKQVDNSDHNYAGKVDTSVILETQSDKPTLAEEPTPPSPLPPPRKVLATTGKNLNSFEPFTSEPGPKKSNLVISYMRSRPAGPSTPPAQSPPPEAPKSFTCGECSKRCVNQTQLDAHMTVHRISKLSETLHLDVEPVKSEDYACELCPKVFHNSEQLKAHGLVHAMPSISCDVVYTAPKEKTPAVGQPNGKKKVPPLSCELCSKRFAMRHHFKAHMASHWKHLVASKRKVRLLKVPEVRTRQLRARSRPASKEKKTAAVPGPQVAKLDQPEDDDEGEEEEEEEEEAAAVVAVAAEEEQLPEEPEAKPQPEEETQSSEAGKSEDYFQCMLCPKICSTRGHLKAHMIVHRQLMQTKKKLAEEKKSKKVNESTESLVAKKRPVCLLCGKECSSKWNLRMHLSTHYSSKSAANVVKNKGIAECPVCQKVISSRSNLAKHIRRLHGIEPAQLYGQVDRILQESRVQSKDKTADVETIVLSPSHSQSSSSAGSPAHDGNFINLPMFSCNVCGNTYNTRSEWEAHMVVHSFGHASSRAASSLSAVSAKANTSRRTHQSEEVLLREVPSKKKRIKDLIYKCDYCPKRCATRGNLKIHMTVHMKKPKKCFKCHYCTKQCSTVGHLKMHIAHKHSSMLMHHVQSARTDLGVQPEPELELEPETEMDVGPMDHFMHAPPESETMLLEGYETVVSSKTEIPDVDLEFDNWTG